MAITYLWRHQRLPNFTDALRFTEMVQRRKLFDRDPQQTALMDKIAAKQMAADLLGPDWTTPTLWQGDALPAWPQFDVPAILKARHGCNQFAVISADPAMRVWRNLQNLTCRWMAGPYGTWLDEWAYKDVPRSLIAETLIGDGRTLPIDYKIYVFGGHATHIQVHLDRAQNHRWVLHDRDFRPLIPASDPPRKPKTLNAMLAAAETLAKGRDFVRVDFYEIAGSPRFGEFCLYPGSGLDPFAADWIDFELGKLWHAARGQSQMTTG